MVNQQRFEKSLIVLPDKLIDDWEPRCLEELTEAHFAFLASLDAEVILLGTGAVLRFLTPLDGATGRPAHWFRSNGCLRSGSNLQHLDG